jgi:putative oxidoreductase
MSSTRPFHETSIFTAKHIDAALLVLRVVLGVVMAAHGGQKVFTIGMAGVAGGFEKMGIPMAGLMGPFISLLELVGGIAIVLGILTRLFAFLIAGDMLVAMLTVHLKNGFFLPSGYEFVLLLAAMSLALMLAGPGDWSIDGAIADRRRNRVATSRI